MNKKFYVQTANGPLIVSAADKKQVRRFLIAHYLKDIRPATADDILTMKDQEGFDVLDANPQTAE